MNDQPILELLRHIHNLHAVRVPDQLSRADVKKLLALVQAERDLLKKAVKLFAADVP